mmetsp:Transcript_14739/g.10636  ORF Transcript_14739/g.10636 Transcript_14739/m.10636 type:complete len:123 (+) Transcript_14739:902-1270(+)
MGLIPHVGLIKPTDKISLGTYIEDLEEMHKKLVDPMTGRIFNRFPITSDLKEREKRWKEGLEKRFAKIETDDVYAEEEDHEKRQAEVLRAIPIDNDYFIPDRKQRYWMIAQTHTMKENKGIG